MPLQLERYTMPLQVRMLTSQSIAEERERSAHRTSKLVDGKSVGLLDGTKPGRKTAFVATPKWSECVSYKLDENGNKVGAHIFRPNERKNNRRKIDKADRDEMHLRILEAQQHKDRMNAIVGNIGNVE